MEIIELLGFGAKGWGALILTGMLLTLCVTLASLAIGALVGGLIATAKLSNFWWLRVLGTTYTTIFRGVPELLIIYLIYFGGSNAVTAIGHAMGIEGFLGMPSFLAGALAVGLISAAYQAEVYRGAYRAIPRGEIEAAASIGMPPLRCVRRIILPQILRFAIPGLNNVWQLSLKDSALISVTGLAELMRTTQVAAGSTRQYFMFYIVGGLLYLVLTSFSERLFNSAERRSNKSMPRGMGQV
ncbi:ABC transporter permease [Thalassospira profundimaris]|uniref:ABC transporter permease n=1 Tax=Thalassospira profundimaris TaxID=502049 RepID=A0A367WV60_9PROT|nr:ABC transporter permease subunit [Thalassospira profundimaris]RCK45278.1 ABC transporter permease [Thalassospira profundimaris]